jgi:hypothetical protein
MVGEFRHRVHPRGILLNTIERSFLATSALVVTLLFLLILFLGIYLRIV